MPIFRLRTIFLVFFSCEIFSNEPINPYGIKRLLLSMVANAIEETIIIEIAAENPPEIVFFF